MEPLGTKIRRQRRRLGLTLDELAAKSVISKPYLSLIETGRVPNPPSDEKLRRLEQTLGFGSGELLTQAHLQRTPRDVRAMIGKLLAHGQAGGNDAPIEMKALVNAALNESAHEYRASNLTAQSLALSHANGSSHKNGSPPYKNGSPHANGAQARNGAAHANGHSPNGDSHINGNLNAHATRIRSGTQTVAGANNDAQPFGFDTSVLCDALQEMAQSSAAEMEKIAAGAVPVVNHVSTRYPDHFTDQKLPPRRGEEYVSCPGITDQYAFAARIYGDGMSPRYHEGDIVIFSPAIAPRPGDDCFIRFTDGKTTFRRIFFENDGKSALVRLQPRNDAHRAATIPAQQIQGLYRAVSRYEKIDEEPQTMGQKV